MLTDLHLLPNMYTHIPKGSKVSKRLFRQTAADAKSTSGRKCFWITQHIYSSQTRCASTVFRSVSEAHRHWAEAGAHPAPARWAFCSTRHCTPFSVHADTRKPWFITPVAICSTFTSPVCFPLSPKCGVCCHLSSGGRHIDSWGCESWKFFSGPSCGLPSRKQLQLTATGKKKKLEHLLLPPCWETGKESWYYGCCKEVQILGLVSCKNLKCNPKIACGWTESGERIM